MSLRHALLGLLADRTASGYDLLKLFDSSLANVWPATQSQIYAELNKLADGGLIKVVAEGPRGRKQYALTEEGLTELRRWLTETEPQPNVRSEVLLRVFFLGVLSREQSEAYLAGLATRFAEEENALRELERGIEWDESDLSLYGRIALEYGLRFNAMRHEWAEWAAAQVK
ncbi:helix-turn-helix transcriptional regulator [Actinoallomurus oryzae]|uniref:Helix-turn-helix transcriptional regulator n=1 Tax=Actinoallomurus oryzae TaxID=502180 RepID=A0ABP8PMW7_9ACTN